MEHMISWQVSIVINQNNRLPWISSKYNSIKLCRNRRQAVFCQCNKKKVEGEMDSVFDLNRDFGLPFFYFTMTLC